MKKLLFINYYTGLQCVVFLTQHLFCSPKLCEILIIYVIAVRNWFSRCEKPLCRHQNRFLRYLETKLRHITLHYVTWLRLFWILPSSGKLFNNNGSYMTFGNIITQFPNPKKCHLRHQMMFFVFIVSQAVMYSCDIFTNFGGHFVFEFSVGKRQNRAWHGADLESAYLKSEITDRRPRSPGPKWARSEITGSRLIDSGYRLQQPQAYAYQSTYKGMYAYRLLNHNLSIINITAKRGHPVETSFVLVLTLPLNAMRFFSPI